MRIVSLLPAATEVICALGLADALVGISHACDYACAALAGKPVLTTNCVTPAAGAGDEPPTAGEIDARVREMLAAGEPIFSIDIEGLRALQPELVIVQGLGDPGAMNHADLRAAVDALPAGVTVLDLAPSTLEDVLDSFRVIGAAANRVAAADDLAAATRARWETVKERTAVLGDRPRTLLIEWPEPPFSAGLWNPELLSLAGATPAPWDASGARSRTLDAAEIAEFAPEVIIVYACGFDAYWALDEAWGLTDLPGWYDLPAVRNGECYVVDGNAYFGRPGPRLAEAAEILATILHPEAFTEMLPPYSVQRFSDDLLTPEAADSPTPERESVAA